MKQSEMKINLYKNYEYNFQTTEPYNYEYAITSDVLTYIEDNFSEAEIIEKLSDPDEFSEELNEELWIEDSVTGNASGSYWYSTWKAEEAISHNWNLIEDAKNEFDMEIDVSKGAEYIDVSIRCMLLYQGINNAISLLKDKFGIND